MSQPHFAIVIPAYNEAATIRDLAQRALAISNIVIIVDDGSTDGTVNELEGLPVKLIQHDTNQGKAASLWDGICLARQHEVDCIITLDGDGQHAPEDIPLLLSKFEEFPRHIIIGARLADKAAIPAKRYYANKIANFWIAWAAGYPIADSQSGFRLYPVELFDGLRIATSKQHGFVFESEILIKAAQRQIYSKPVRIPAVYAENARPSHFHGVRDITFITLMVARFLITHLLFPQGLYRSVLKPRLPTLPDESTDTDGIAMLALSTLVILLSGGLTLVLLLLYVLKQAIFCTTNSAHERLLLVFGKQLQNNLPDQEYQARLLRACTLLNSDPHRHVLILGGQTGNASISESQAGRDFLVLQGIAQGRIQLEDRSRNTLENIKEAIKLMDLSNTSVTLISNRYHLARIATMARGFGLQVHCCAAENFFHLSPMIGLRLIIEAAYLHWYFTGKYWAQLTNNQRMLDRIS